MWGVGGGISQIMTHYEGLGLGGVRKGPKNYDIINEQPQDTRSSTHNS